MVRDLERASSAAEVAFAETTPRHSTGSGQRVLVVDDNHDVAISLAMLLRYDGYDVEVVHDGPDALHSARLRPPEIVLLDLGMPSMDGFEVCRALRREGSKAFIVALTGYGEKEDRLRTQEAGFDAHLVKPALPDEIATLIAKHSDLAARRT